MVHTEETALKFKYMQQGMVSAGASLLAWETPEKGRFKEQEKAEQHIQEEGEA